ncbi:MAG: glycosyltransferase family 4 protein [Gammaproteobacteria bacterium]|jgi:UDP-N-acetylmuramyl pentapeptide phosphotransferase/UDP-N-acetylglucosamine-1-phosphate transferase|nr:glycosyltransferase family 4 protein [Gammaproteobacteria bacterium]
MLLASFSALITSTVLAWILSRTRGRWLAVDIPNHRSLHTTPTPRSGGLAILAGAAAGVFTHWLSNGDLLLDTASTAAVLALVMIALVDEHYPIAAGLRLLLQTLVVAGLLISDPVPEVTSLPWFALLLGLVWMINLYNFMDGMDGFAGGMAITGFGTFALLAWQSGNVDLALACAILVAACSGFLLLNFPPARLFMGDTGSTVLGLLAGMVIFKAHLENILPFWLGLLVFSPFIVDASVTLATRILRGEKFWLPHKSHNYQILVESGWGHKRTVLAEYALMLACSATAIAAAPQSPWRQATIIAGWALLYAILIYLIRRTARRREPQT